ncbi:hypothetical protein O1L60_26125 [Streptomyces diastatochromogenes]|nr:hypothetical protein [Streptomyces diastatochromogenes]
MIGVLADGAGKASVNVSLTWTEPGRTTGPTAGAASDSAGATAGSASGPASDSAGPTAGPVPGSAGPEGAEPRSGIGPQRRPAADGAA